MTLYRKSHPGIPLRAVPSLSARISSRIRTRSDFGPTAVQRPRLLARFTSSNDWHLSGSPSCLTRRAARPQPHAAGESVLNTPIACCRSIFFIGPRRLPVRVLRCGRPSQRRAVPVCCSIVPCNSILVTSRSYSQLDSGAHTKDDRVVPPVSQKGARFLSFATSRF